MCDAEVKSEAGRKAFVITVDQHTFNVAVFDKRSLAEQFIRDSHKGAESKLRIDEFEVNKDLGDWVVYDEDYGCYHRMPSAEHHEVREICVRCREEHFMEI